MPSTACSPGPRHSPRAISADEFRRTSSAASGTGFAAARTPPPRRGPRLTPPRARRLGLQAATLQLDAPVVGSHETAAAVHEIELWEPSYEWINVTRPDRSARREGGVWHHEAGLPDDEVVRRRRTPVTSIIRTGLDVARYARDHEHALVAVDSALRSVGGTYDERAVALAAMRALHLERADWPGARMAGGAVASPIRDAGSVGESRTRVRLVELGLPAPLIPGLRLRRGRACWSASPTSRSRSRRP